MAVFSKQWYKMSMKKKLKYKFPENSIIKASGFQHFANHSLEDLKKKSTTT